MIARRVELETPSDPVIDAHLPREQPDHRDPVAAWLDVLRSLLRLPAAEKQSVLDELESHLRDRVRDLMVTGLSENHAADKALGELGNAASLAREFRAARHTPTRRTLMNLAIVGLAAGGFLTGLVALNGTLRPQAVAVSVFQPAATPSAAPKALIRFNQVQEIPWPEFFDFLGKSAGMPVYVHWPSLGSIGGPPPIEEGSSVTLRFTGELPLDRALELINDDLEYSPDNRIDFRVRDGRIIFASTQFFDRQETTLASYDLSDLVNQRIARGADEDHAPREVVEQVSGLITTLVNTNQWVDNGGDLATLTNYGSKLFVKAPKRFHPQIQWILTEVGTGQRTEESKRAQAEDQAPVVQLYPLKHADAHNALEALKANQAIRKIDFTKFTYDSQRNAIIASAIPSHHEMFAKALKKIDVPQDAAQKDAANTLVSDLRGRLAAAETASKSIEADLAAARARTNPNHRSVKNLEADLATLQDQQKAWRQDLEKAEKAIVP